jgi:glycosyltransferase involved in cell wall biosynthesis
MLSAEKGFRPGQTGRPKISVLINTCNESHVLRECLDSVVGWADEIVVCDMESSDDSAAISRAAGAAVWSHKRMLAPEPEARTFGIGKCTGEWVLILDPDMRVSAPLRARLDQLVTEDQADIVDFYCVNFMFTKWCKRGHGSQPVFRKFFKRRLFDPKPKNIQTFWHDSLLPGRVLGLPKKYAITHYAYPTIENMVDILVRYARREADDEFRRGRTFRLWPALWGPTKRFIGNYFIRRGFLDGMPGLIVSAGVSGYLFLIEAYLWELGRRREPGRQVELSEQKTMQEVDEIRTI